MKAKKLLAMLCCGALALSVLAGCGGSGDDKKGETQKQETEKEDEKKEEATKTDPSDPVGYYQFSYEVEGNGLWVNYIHLYDETSIGKVFYAGYASNQIAIAGTYEIEEKSCDYKVHMTREDVLDDKEGKNKKEGTADYTITFYSFDGVELGSCAYDGEYIYNDTETISGTGAEQVAFLRDVEGLDSKYGQASSGYGGEKGMPYVKAYSEADETCTVTLNHDSTYSDMMEMEVVGTWAKEADGVTYTLTPDSESDTAAVLVVSEDGMSATYTPDGGEAAELKIKKKKPVAFKYAAVIAGADNTLGMDIDCWINCYSDKTCEAFIGTHGVEMAIDAGTYENSTDGAITFHFEKGGDMSSDNIDEIAFTCADTPAGDIGATLTRE